MSSGWKNVSLHIKGSIKLCIVIPNVSNNDQIYDFTGHFNFDLKRLLNNRHTEAAQAVYRPAGVYFCYDMNF